MTDGKGRKLKYWQAINQTLAAEMERDETVCAFGEDIAVGGGSFGATRGLLERFGPNRVRDTPISELAIAAVGTGAAMTGTRPVLEIMYMDFIQLALDQVVNQAAKMRFMAGGAYSVPLTIRTLVASRMQSGPQHSQSFEAWLGSVPGLRVVWPSTAADAAGLLRAAIRSDDPVVFMESLALWRAADEVPDEHVVPIGKAAVRRPGGDVTIVCVGGATIAAMAAAEELAGEGIEAEVLDLRSISPLDTEAIVTSVARTGALVTVQDAPVPFGIGQAAVAAVAVADPTLFKAPPRVVGPPFSPTPFSPDLEKRFYPTSERIVAEVKAAVDR
ncbi:MAG TPA: transketolase C-terminal domain-containing protein [Solirubrobacterales bacterium]|jgi:pyruvate dehydrogenase E1 component beta subunit|nr:transketolase C-terminal domain-containing protein [Solirubrobacterales bacterium]